MVVEAFLKSFLNKLDRLDLLPLSFYSSVLFANGRVSNLVGSFDSGYDFIWISGPGERFGVLVGFGDEGIDGGLKIDDGMEGAPVAVPIERCAEAPVSSAVNVRRGIGLGDLVAQAVVAVSRDARRRVRVHYRQAI